MKKFLSVSLIFFMVICFAPAMQFVSASVFMSGQCGSNVYWELTTDDNIDNIVLTISGTGDMYDYSSSSRVPWDSWDNYIDYFAIEYGVTSIGDYAFSHCGNLSSISIPNSVTSIGDYAFRNCDNLSSISIPNSVTSIGDYAFYLCRNLSSIYIAYGVTSIGEHAFSGCYSLQNINVDDRNSVYSAIDGVFFNKKKTRLIKYPEGKNNTSYTIPNSVTSIGDYAFRNCDNLSSIYTPNSVTSIGNWAFSYCENLSSIYIPNSVTSIGENAFTCCVSLSSISIPNSVTSIEYETFASCDNLSSIYIPNSVTSIGESAFSNCKSLSSISIPDSVTSIGEHAFDNCYSLQNINVDDRNSAYSSIDGVLFNKQKTRLIEFPQGKNNTNYTIPNSVTSIGDNAFQNCNNLSSISIPYGVTSIRNWAFSYCRSLSSISIPNSVKSIGESAFYYCDNLKDVYYLGTASQWNKISIGTNNTPLTNATKHYLYGLYNDNISINHYGRAYGRLQLISSSGKALSNKTVTYTIDGYSGTYSGKTDENGIITIETPMLFGDDETKTITVRFPDESLEKESYSFDVYIKPLSFSQTFEGKVSAFGGVKAGLGAGGSIGVAEAEASLGHIGADAKLAKNLSIENSYENGVRSLRLSSAMDLDLAADAKVGLFAKADATVTGVDLSVADVSGNAGFGASNEIALVIDNYDPSNLSHLRKIAYFLLDASTDTAGSNTVARKIFEQFNAQSYNESATKRTAHLKGGANFGAIEAGVIEGSIAGIGSSSTWTYKALNDKINDKNVYSSSIVADVSGSIGGLEIKSSKVDLIPSVATASFINNNLLFTAVNNGSEIEEFKIRSAEKSHNNSILWNVKTTDYYNTITFSGENAEKAVKTSTDLNDFANGKKGWFSALGMVNRTKELVNSGIIYDYTREKEISNGFDADFNFGAMVGVVGVDIGFGISCIESLSYEIESGESAGGNAYKISESFIDSKVANSKKELSEIVMEPIEVIKSHISSLFDIISGSITEGVRAGTAYVKNVGNNIKNWTVNIVKFKEASSESYSILCLTSEADLFSTTSVASTIGEPYIISVCDENGTEILDFGDESVSVSLSCDEEMLSEAGVEATEENFSNVKIFRWDENKASYIYVGGTSDFESLTVTAEINQPGQYILATDNCAPAITEFKASNCSSSPEITAVVADMSGISEFEFKIDGNIVVSTENFAEYYNPSTALFKYTPSVSLDDGEHIATIYAKDSSGNETSPVSELTFTVNTVSPVITEINIPEYSTSKDFTISAKAEDDDLSSLVAYVSYGEDCYTYHMAVSDGLWVAEIEDVPDLSDVSIYIEAFDTLGNSTKSEDYNVPVIYTSENGIRIEIKEINNDGVIICAYNGGDLISGNLLVAGYTSGGMLKTTTNTEYVLPVGYSKKTVAISPEFDLYKAFMWKDISSLSPLIDYASKENS